jgi:hypothetical protein
MFKKNDIIKLVNDYTLDAKSGSLAIVTNNGYDEIDECYFVNVKWLEITSHLNGEQGDGGYAPDRFELVVPGASNK